MDEEMGEASEGDLCLGFDVDFDYEYDAPKFFDLSAEEPVMEASSAEEWFDTADSYPPSPLIMKIVCDEDIFSDNASHNPDSDAQLNPSELNDVTKEETHFRIIENVPKGGFKAKIKSHASKVSTLMKPTASYLAKKTQRYEPASLIKNNKLNPLKSLESTGELKDGTVQAAKRQRLEKGHLGKATGTAQPDLIHKTREKTDTAYANGNAVPARTRVTVPREPDLQTMRRAERFHARRGLTNANEPPAHVQPKTTHKTHPSCRNELNLTNRSRVLEDPSVVASKALQGCEEVSRRSDNRNSKNSRLNSVNRKQECRGSIFFFKAETSDKKVAPRNGNAVIPRNTKPQATVPKEHKLYTNRRQQNPPPLTEVFNKLSLATEAQHISTSKTPFFVPAAYGSKV
ncbi:uncharacterized protein LOC144557038 isoform X1 [Carex rostrata]